ALAAGLAAGLATRSPDRIGGPGVGRSRPTTASVARSSRWTAPLPASAVAAVAAALLAGGATGLLLGAAAGTAVHRWLVGAESLAARRRRAEVERDLPLAVDLLVACLTAGRSPDVAMSAVAEAMPGVLGDRLRATAARLALGGDPQHAWHDLAADPALAPLGQALARSARTGASVTTTLAGLADDIRRRRRSRAQAVARSVGVRAAAPLGACFLPAFLLIGVVPTIIGAFGGLTG